METAWTVHLMALFIINEHAIIPNMARPEIAPDLDLYRPALQKWMPKAEIRAAGKALPRFDGIVTWKTPDGPLRYLVEEKRHLRHQDVGVVVEQLNRRRADLPADHANDRLLLLAPHVRIQQAAALERAEIDYLDLAGNAHLQAPGLFVHVEGRQPRKEPTPAPRRPQKGWIKTVMAILIRPELTNAPYRTLADHADVALGTLAGCMNDLAARGLLLDGKGGRKVADRQALVALWVQAYIEGLRPKLKERRLQIRAEEKQEIWTGWTPSCARAHSSGHSQGLTLQSAARISFARRRRRSTLRLERSRTAKPRRLLSLNPPCEAEIY